MTPAPQAPQTPQAPPPPPPSPPRLQLVVDSDEETAEAAAAIGATDATPSPAIRKQGWLQLLHSSEGKGARSGGWAGLGAKKRWWFVLTDEVLAYFQSEAEGQTMADLHTFHASVRLRAA